MNWDGLQRSRVSRKRTLGGGAPCELKHGAFRRVGGAWHINGVHAIDTVSRASLVVSCHKSMLAHSSRNCNVPLFGGSVFRSRKFWSRFSDICHP
jgi:hypothetical protein